MPLLRRGALSCRRHTRRNMHDHSCNDWRTLGDTHLRKAQGFDASTATWHRRSWRWLRGLIQSKTVFQN